MKLLKIVNEIGGIYSPEELESKNITYKIVEQNFKRFVVHLTYTNKKNEKYYYKLLIIKITNNDRHIVAFGSTNENFYDSNMDDLVNLSHSPRILAAIFGLIKYYVNKFNIEELEYTAEGDVRNKLYDLYLKNFSDMGFKHYIQDDHGIEVIIWKKD
jgi:hypothetical protein